MNNAIYPVVFKDVIPSHVFVSLHDELLNEWTLANTSDSKYGDDSLSWGLRYKNDRIIMYQAASIVKLKCQKIIREHIRLCKIHVNGQTFGQKGGFHTDFDDPWFWTFVLFTSPEWNTQWSGEFVCQDPSGEYHYVPYIPNNGVLIPSNWPHYGCSPNAFTDKLRTSVAFSYIHESKLPS